MNPTRIARNISTAAVASIAAWSSWSHMVHVALKFGERPEVAYVLPISVDGMLVVASTAMVDDRRAGRPVRWSARIAFIIGVGASVAANIAAAQPTLGARIVAAWPAVALLLVVEMLSRARRASVSTPAASAVTGPAGAASVEADGEAQAVSDSTPATGISPAGRTSDTPRRPGTPGHRRQRGGRTEAVLRMRTERPDASVEDIATHLGVTERHVRRLLMSARQETG
ncbi:DUF2637 domain-containing protein [Micromonospora sp. NPDC047793]|uniref:DUF2637 domain-containing protein n=1 Tax=Micromonospora sp. NPDC047793 TaxID=3154342 RepID=UPI0033FF90C6